MRPSAAERGRNKRAHPIPGALRRYARRGASSEAVVAPSFRPRPAVVFVPNFQDQGGAAWVVGPLQAPRGFLGHLQTSFVTCGSLSNVSRPGHLKKDARHEQKKVAHCFILTLTQRTKMF